VSRTQIALSVCAALGAIGGLAALRAHRRRPPVVGAAVAEPTDETSVDQRGAVRSVQAAEVTLPADALAGMWNALHLERLARAYWRYLSRVTLGLIRVVYTESERFVVLLTRPFVLLRFQAPEYELEGDRGVVRWRIERGVLVSKRGRGGDGYLEIDVRRLPEPRPEVGRVRIEVEVANFYPAIASALSRWVYTRTQSRIHVLVTHGFLRSLVRLDLPLSRVGRYAAAPAGPGERQDGAPAAATAQDGERAPTPRR
jgi:hypothetical protein